MQLSVTTRLLELTQEFNNQFKIAAIYALGEGGHPTLSVTTRLLDLTRDQSNDVKEAAIRALGRINRPSAPKA
ncbi:HEAT repeat domain-containing protein [Rahnella inusitata]|uniref:HEAT repeat domain-containing protein n=1 Tax=Rahnella TaxID=34037 RepID=UPI0039BE9051